MILHCTKKLAKKINPVLSDLIAETSPLGSWHANLYFFDRRQCVLFCHDDTRYTLFLPGLRKEHFINLGRLFKHTFTASLAVIGIPDAQISRAELALGPMQFDTYTDRSVLGTLNQMKFMLEYKVYEVGNVLELDPLAISKYLSDTPVTVRGHRDHRWPIEAMAQRVAAL